VPERIQLSRAKGWRMPEETVKIDRSTRFGNPFEVGRRVIAPGAYGSLASPYHGSRPRGMYGMGPRAYEITTVKSRPDAVRLFASYIKHDPSGWPPADIRRVLGGRNLACWCDLPEPGELDWCHGFPLMCMANGWEIPFA
jgi:hypothetical protein